MSFIQGYCITKCRMQRKESCTRCAASRILCAVSDGWSIEYKDAPEEWRRRKPKKKGSVPLIAAEV
jgi:hypothetical protein